MHTSEARRFGTLPSAAGVLTRLACAHMKTAGLDPAPLLRKAGMSVDQVESRSTRLRAQNQVRFIELVAEALNDDFLGFHLARDYDLRQIGLLHYVFGSSDMLGDALQRAVRYARIVNESLALKYRENCEVAVDISYVGVPRSQDCHQSEFLMATILRACREATGRRLQPLHVKFAHHRSSDCSQLNAFLGVDAEFAAGADEITFPVSISEIPVMGADPFLNDLLVDYCEEALSRHRTGERTFRLEVENALVPLLPHGKARLGEIARRLGLSERTLARRLSQESVTFNTVLEELKFDLAKRYLGDPDLSISEIAWLLGYQEVSAFTHAFKRWSGKTPRQTRSEVAIAAE